MTRENTCRACGASICSDNLAVVAVTLPGNLNLDTSWTGCQFCWGRLLRWAMIGMVGYSSGALKGMVTDWDPVSRSEDMGAMNSLLANDGLYSRMREAK